MGTAFAPLSKLFIDASVLLPSRGTSLCVRWRILTLSFSALPPLLKPTSPRGVSLLDCWKPVFHFPMLFKQGPHHKELSSYVCIGLAASSPPKLRVIFPLSPPPLRCTNRGPRSVPIDFSLPPLLSRQRFFTSPFAAPRSKGFWIRLLITGRLSCLPYAYFL